MKKVAVILLMAFSANGQTDKVAHFGVGYITGATTSATVLRFSNGKNKTLKTLSFGIASGLIVGTGKELYDLKSYGVFNWKDLGATVIGSALGSVTVRISINN